MSIDVMKQALKALETNLLVIEDYGDHEQLNRQHKAITALRAAIEQAQEPVATVTSESENPNVSMSWWHEPALPVGTKLYTTPPHRKPLTADQVFAIADQHPVEGFDPEIMVFVRAIEAAHGIKEQP